MDKEVSQFISSLRIPLVLLVISIHLSGITSELSECFVAFVSRIAVPLFFVISGYLFFISKKPFKTKIKDRVKSLVVPFYVWIFIGTIHSLLAVHLSLASSSSPYYNISNLGIIIKSLGLFEQLPSPNVPLWYIRNLFIICCLSPLLVVILKKNPRSFITCGLIFYLLKISPLITQTVVFFSIGICIGMYNITLEKIFRPIRALTIAICIVLCFSLLFYVNSETTLKFVFSQLGSLCLMYLVPCFFYRLVNQNVLIQKYTILIDSAFFVYVSHSIFIGIFSIINIRFFQNCNEIEAFIIFIIEVFVIFLMSFVCFYILRKICPKVLHFINGR